MTEHPNGQVVTFYSYKGGTGRTMALANVAWILASNGYRVLVADWDLESPGLHRFFSPFIDAEKFGGTGGVTDLVRAFEWETSRKVEREDQWYRQFARVQRYAFSIDWEEFPAGATLDFLSSGRQNDNYAATLNAIDWDTFYENLGGGLFLDALREDMRRNYDYTLIDSRTGLSDVAGICTVQLPDTVVACFTLSEQGISGVAEVARVIQREYASRNIRILPVPMRVDPAEKIKADAGVAWAMQHFPGLPANLSDDERASYWAGMQVPYRAFYAYEELLATFGDPPGSPLSLLSAYEALTGYITMGGASALPPIDPALRERINIRFTRHLATVEDEVRFSYAPEDQVWAEWIEHVLVSAGVRVYDRWAAEGRADDSSPTSARQLVIVSHTNAGREALVVTDEHSGARDPLAVYIGDTRPLARFLITNSAFVGGQPVGVAVERLLKLVGRSGIDISALLAGGPRFPGEDAAVFHAPARNARFTGREGDLQQLRLHLRTGGAAVVLPGAMPVALQGMGGIGKTQVALEYVHRFRSAYDVVFWVTADPVSFVESALADLGARLGLPPQATVAEMIRVVLSALGRGDPYQRWLVIYDNAEDPDRVGQFLPSGPGHVLVTSRNPAWGDRAQALQVDVFKRRESIAHLRMRIPNIKTEEADQAAELLGDLPIAVAAAAAWLADTGTSVADYLEQIERLGPRISSVEATWDLSLQRLQDQSPAANRLLQLCSVLAPEISLDLVYSDEMARSLEEFDPTLSERSVRGKLVQVLNRLALIRLDIRRGREPQRGPGGQAGQLLVHRLLQHVVRSRMTEVEVVDARHQVHRVLGAARPDGEVDDPETWPKFRLLWPHLEASDALNCPSEAVRRLLIEQVRYAWLSGSLVQGRELAESIDQAWVGRLGELAGKDEEPVLRRQLLHLRFNLANILRYQAQFRASRALDEAVLAEQGELLGSNHAHTLMTAGSLASDLRALGHYAQALERDKVTYAAWAELFGEDDPRSLNAQNNLAVSYRMMGDFIAARELDEAVYERRRVVLGDGHPFTLISASNLGRDLRELGEFEPSIALLRSVADAYVEVLGPDSPGALAAKANLAVSLRFAAGRAPEAAELLETAYERLNDTVGHASPDTLACRLSRAVNLWVMGASERAERELTAVEEEYRRSLGQEHPHTVICANNLAAVVGTQGEWARAQELALMAADHLSQTLSPDHPYTLAAEMNVAISSAEEGDLDRARELATDALGRIAGRLGPEHPFTLAGQVNLALILAELGEINPALDKTAAIERFARWLGADHPAVRDFRAGRYVFRIIDPHPF